MAKTRKELAANNRELAARLAAQEGNTRKTLNARVHSAEEQNKKLQGEFKSLTDSTASIIKNLQEQIDGLKQTVAELKNEVSA